MIFTANQDLFFLGGQALKWKRLANEINDHTLQTNICFSWWLNTEIAGTIADCKQIFIFDGGAKTFQCAGLISDY